MIAIAVVAAANFADQVLRELIAAMGGALFVGNLLALIRRRNPQEGAAPAPIARTLVYLLIGFVVMLSGIASVLTAR